MTAAHTPSEVGDRTSSDPSCASSTTESAAADRFRKGILDSDSRQPFVTRFVSAFSSSRRVAAVAA